MKISRAWLQKYFTDPLPDTESLDESLTFHAFEIEDRTDDLLDVKVLPDRASYALSHRGIATDVAAILDRPLSEDPLRTPLPDYAPVANSFLSVDIEDPARCPRYMGALIRGVKVGPSPAWLREALESDGQRSINNVVDATNYVMLDIGQPLHAFDAGKLAVPEADPSAARGAKILVRASREGEKITTLSGEEYELPEGTLLITDGVSDAPLAIAGIKGGTAAQVDESTTDIVIEAANFEGSCVRKTAQAIKLFTDASLRYQNKLSPELVAYGMRDVLAQILEVAGGEIMSVTDTYPVPAAPQSPVHGRLEKINSILGTAYSAEDVAGAFTRLGLQFTQEGDSFALLPPFERRDLRIVEDLAEEVGRILGYDSIPSKELPAMEEAPDQKKFQGIERMKDVLASRGYIEVSTQSFAATGDILLENPLQSDKPALRTSLLPSLKDALDRAQSVAPRVIGPDPVLKLFELGTVFPASGEHLSLALGYRQLAGKPSAAMLVDDRQALLDLFAAFGMAADPSEKEEAGMLELSLVSVDLAAAGKDRDDSKGEGALPEIVLGPYTPFSLYPSAIRDIAVWTPAGTEGTEVSATILSAAGDLLARIDQFDSFEKDGRISYAFRLVFQSFERTLSDADLDPVMMAVTETLNAKEDFQVR